MGGREGRQYKGMGREGGKTVKEWGGREGRQ